MVNRSNILVNGSQEELLAQPSDFSDNRSDFLVNGSPDKYSDQPSELSDIINQREVHADLVTYPLGVIMNILCLITFIKSKISQSPTGLILTYLAIFDNMVLISLFTCCFNVF